MPSKKLKSEKNKLSVVKNKKKLSVNVPSAAKSRKALRREWERLVGREMYSLWIKMLKQLGPHGRTHRLAVVVAGMLEYAASCRPSERGANEVRRLLEGADPYFESSDAGAIDRGYDDYEDGPGESLPYESPLPVIEQLFWDAKVRWKKVNSKGRSYSIAGTALEEFFNWELMPWE
jgi:hypothetical protein